MMRCRLVLSGLFCLFGSAPLLSLAADPLIVVEDHGGVSALPYYEALNLQPRSGLPAPVVDLPKMPAAPVTDADMLPVHSFRLTPGTVMRRTLEAPGLQPFFLVGDDELSRRWLADHASSLRERGFVGLVVNVQTPEALAHLRELALGISLSPVSADDLADRLGLDHYPAQITATGIEQ